jgi:hypothetical protein
MLPSIPKLDINTVYIMTGKMLKRLGERVRLQTPLAGTNITLEETNDGILLHATPPATVAPTLAINHDFKASLPATNSLDITAGKVIGTVWGTPTMSAPLPTDWLSEQFTVGPATLAVASGESVWLRIQCSQTDVEMNGALSPTGATTLSVTTGGGGAGGGGGGGGAGGDGTAGYSGDVGASASGQTPGGVGTTNALGGTAVGENSGDPAEGGNGGNGAAGGNGQTKSFTHYTKLLMVFRRWQITSASLEVHANKPTAAPATNIYIRIASQTAGVVTQYHAGSYHITLPSTTYISTLVP